MATRKLPFRAMACDCLIHLEGLDVRLLEPAAQAARDEVLRIEAKYSRYRADSVLSAINRNAQGVALAVDEETAGLLDFGARLHALSGGLFDLSSGVLRHAWNFAAAQVPEAVQLAPWLARVGWERVEWDGERLRLPEPGMELDFGGIGKEYAADRAQAVLAAHGLRHGFVNLGGDLRLLGPRADGSAWRLGIQHPRQPGAVVASLSLQHGALATSGDYERFFERDGRRYCHLLNPRSGQPVRHWQSISVTAPLCAAAGAVSTCAMLMEDQAPAWLRAQGLSYLAVAADGSLHHHAWTH